MGIIAAGVGAGLVAARWRQHRHDEAADARSRTIAAFLAAERHSLLGTWVVDLRWTRLVNSRPGEPLVENLRRAQRPPDHLFVGPGTVDSVYRGRRMACAAGPDGDLHCRDAGAQPSYEAEANEELRNLRAYVEGADPPYTVTVREPGCFLLTLRRGLPPTLPYGTRAELCFDPATGAPVRTELDKPEGEDIMVATSVAGVVTDADLQPPS